METFYADKFFQSVGLGNYGESYNFAGSEGTYVFELANGQIGVFHRIESESSQKLKIYVYDQNLKYVSEKTVALRYTEWGGIYQGEDGNYYAAVGQNNNEEDDSKIVYSIVKMDGNFQELSRCNITGKECSTTILYDVGTARMIMNGTNLIVHTDRERYLASDGLNHQSNISFIIDTATMKQRFIQYVKGRLAVQV